MSDVTGLTCQYCGEHDPLRWNEKTRTKLIEQNACHACGFWLDHARRDSIDTADKYRYVVTADWEHYMVGLEDGDNPRFRGFGGAKFYVDWRDPERSTTITTNLWSQGVIPEHMRDRFTINADMRSA